MGRAFLVAWAGLLCFPAALWAEDEPAAADVDRAVAELREAYESDDEIAIVEAMERSVGVPDARVVALVDRGTRSKSAAVRRTAIDVLGRMDHQDALKALHALYRREPKLGEDEDLFALLFRSIGRHGDPSSVDVLKDKPFRYLTFDVGNARIMGLGNVRDASALEALVEASRKAGGRGATGAESELRGRFRPAFRVAMVVLTGVDRGDVPADWDTWWRDNRRGLVVAPERPQVPEDVRQYWERYWSDSYYPRGEEPPPPSTTPPIQTVESPSPEQVEAAVAALKEAFASKDEGTIASAIEENAAILHPDVVHEVAVGLRSRSRAVRMATVDALGWMRIEPALRQLHRMYARERNLSKEDEDLFALLLKSIGRHGDPDSVEVLSDHPFRGLTLESGRARILGLGNVRTVKALEALLHGSTLAGSTGPRSWRPSAELRFVKEFRLALHVLTGEDLGASPSDWQTWWREHKRGYQVSPVRPTIPAALERVWEEYWREPYAP